MSELANALAAIAVFGVTLLIVAVIVAAATVIRIQQEK